ncbi:MAG: NADPH-dependent F420 reductase [Actinomycetota bacterium]
MRVAIIGGTAGLGYGLALRLAAAGDEVTIGSRTADKAQAAAAKASQALGGKQVDSAENPVAVKGADAVVVTVPFPGQAAMYKAIKENMTPGTVVLDCNVPLASEVGGKATRLLGVWEGSAAQQAKGILGKDFPVASGFHTVMSGRLESVDDPLDGDVLVCGDKAARDVAEKIVGKIKGARYVDCGPLESARILESLTALLIGLNIRYKLEEGAGAGIRIQGLP